LPGRPPTLSVVPPVLLKHPHTLSQAPSAPSSQWTPASRRTSVGSENSTADRARSRPAQATATLSNTQPQQHFMDHPSLTTPATPSATPLTAASLISSPHARHAALSNESSSLRRPPNRNCNSNSNSSSEQPSSYNHSGLDSQNREFLRAKADTVQRVALASAFKPHASLACSVTLGHQRLDVGRTSGHTSTNSESTGELWGLVKHKIPGRAPQPRLGHSASSVAVACGSERYSICLLYWCKVQTLTPEELQQSSPCGFWRKRL